LGGPQHSSRGGFCGKRICVFQKFPLVKTFWGFPPKVPQVGAFGDPPLGERVCGTPTPSKNPRGAFRGVLTPLFSQGPPLGPSQTGPNFKSVVEKFL